MYNQYKRHTNFRRASCIEQDRLLPPERSDSMAKIIVKTKVEVKTRVWVKTRRR